MTTCVTATDTFGADGTVVLLPRGTKLLGETRGQVQQGASRVFVLWTEARTPSGVVIPLDSPGTDALGRSGLAGKVNRHFWQRFGAAILISVIYGAIEYAAQSQNQGGAVIYDPGATQQVMTEALKGTVNIAPTVTVANGSSVSIITGAISKRSGMPPNASTAAWRPPAEPGWAARVLKIAGASLVALVVAQYLSGFILLWLLDLDPHGASPLTVLRYGYYYGGVPHVRAALLGACAGGTVLVLLSPAVLLIPRRRPLHGEARFATRREVAAAGLLGDQGIILGRIGRRCLMLRGQQGVVLAAPPRAGKGVGVVIPNLLNWPDSVICVDIKRD
jgi:hypothetical protein